jgi:hypothetical protein
MTSEEILFDCEERMEKVLSNFKDELSSIPRSPRMVSSSIFTGFAKVLIDRHGDRVLGQEQYNKLITMMGDIERFWQEQEKVNDAKIPVQEAR